LLVDVLATGQVVSLLESQLVILFLPDLGDHARGSAKEHDMSNAVNDPCHCSAFADDKGNHVANTREALHAIVEPNQLQITWVWNQIELIHQMKARARDGQARAAKALEASTAATSVSLAAH
jgi:hypothetical protein